MRFKQIEDILDWVVSFHSNLESCYRKLEKGNTKERVVMLLDYLTEHQHTLGDAIKKFKNDASDSVLHTWFNQTPKVDYAAKLATLAERVSGQSTAEVVSIAIECHDLLIDLYKELQHDSETKESKELFQALIDMEEHEKIRMVRDAGRLEDL